MEVVHAMRIIIKFIRKLRFTKKNEMEMNFILCMDFGFLTRGILCQE